MHHLQTWAEGTQSCNSTCTSTSTPQLQKLYQDMQNKRMLQISCQRPNTCKTTNVLLCTWAKVFLDSALPQSWKQDQSHWVHVLYNTCMHCCDTYALELLPAIVISSKTPFTCRQSTFCDRPSILSPKRKHTSHIGRMAQSQVCWACTVDLDSRCLKMLKLVHLLLPANAVASWTSDPSGEKTHYCHQ